MSKLIWDNTGERTFESGIDHGVLYMMDETKAYNQAHVWNGLVSIAESPEGAEPTDLWADNIKYASLRSAENFGGTIEAYTYPPAFAECDGSALVAPGVYIGQQGRKTFGLCYRTMEGDDTSSDMNNYKLHLIWGASASPSEKTYETINDSPDAATFSWEFDTVPVVVTGHAATAQMVISSRNATKEKLAALEAILFGTDNDDARLPLPDEIIQLMNAA